MALQIKSFIVYSTETWVGCLEVQMRSCTVYLLYIGGVFLSALDSVQSNIFSTYLALPQLQESFNTTSCWIWRPASREKNSLCDLQDDNIKVKKWTSNVVVKFWNIIDVVWMLLHSYLKYKVILEIWLLKWI